MQSDTQASLFVTADLSLSIKAAFLCGSFNEEMFLITKWIKAGQGRLTGFFLVDLWRLFKDVGEGSRYLIIMQHVFSQHLTRTLSPS